MCTPQGAGSTLQRDLQAEIVRTEVRLHDVPHEDCRLRLLLPEALSNLPSTTMPTQALPMLTEVRQRLAAVKKNEARNMDNFNWMSLRKAK